MKSYPRVKAVRYKPPEDIEHEFMSRADQRASVTLPKIRFLTGEKGEDDERNETASDDRRDQRRGTRVRYTRFVATAELDVGDGDGDGDGDVGDGDGRKG
jgi:hypothetical protein